MVCPYASAAQSVRRECNNPIAHGSKAFSNGPNGKIIKNGMLSHIIHPTTTSTSHIIVPTFSECLELKPSSLKELTLHWLSDFVTVNPRGLGFVIGGCLFKKPRVHNQITCCSCFCKNRDFG
jgi:hypothetical protein